MRCRASGRARSQASSTTLATGVSAGVRPASPAAPFQSPRRDYCFRHLGWTLSAATAEMVAEAVLAQERAGHKGRFFSFASNADSGAQKGVNFEGAGLDGVWRGGERYDLLFQRAA